jgi:hypothetical protein
MLGISCILQTATTVTYALAMLQWPGGDDRGGMAWLLFVGPLTALPIILAAVMT